MSDEGKQIDTAIAVRRRRLQALAAPGPPPTTQTARGDSGGGGQSPVAIEWPQSARGGGAWEKAEKLPVRL